MISAIIPCYNEEEALPLFLPELQRVADTMDEPFEFLFIDDGSTDRTLELLRSFAARDSRVRYLSFSRNFGKEAAIYAGFQHARGDYAAVMDADLQDPPSLLPGMLELLQSGEYDSVATRRVSRSGGPLLPPHQPYFRRGHRGRSPGFPADEAVHGGRHRLHGRVQPLFQGHLRLGWLPHLLDAL